jgi:hypothetical protein
MPVGAVVVRWAGLPEGGNRDAHREPEVKAAIATERLKPPLGKR